MNKSANIIRILTLILILVLTIVNVWNVVEGDLNFFNYASILFNILAVIAAIIEWKNYFKNKK